MADMPKRDITGECEGECKDRVSDMEKEQQKKMDEEGMEGSTAETPSVGHAKSRDNAPGDLVGHV
jgi:hypothetical protein